MAQVPCYINATRVSNVLTWPLVNEAVESALLAVSNTRYIKESSKLTSFVHQPPRSLTKCGKNSNILFTMPGYVGNYSMSSSDPQDSIVGTGKVSTLACKLVTSFPENEKHNLPNIMANILLFNHNTGVLECIMDGTQITAWRTASASVVATKYLYFRRFGNLAENEKPINVAIIGCGVQGESHALGMCATYKVTNIYLWNRTTSKADQLALKLNAMNKAHITEVTVAKTPDEAIANADVICVGTFAPHALIDYGMLSNRIVHINTVGAGQVHFGEVAQDIYDNGIVYVDSIDSAKTELKDLKAKIIGEIGEVILGGNYPAESDRITIFQSMGIAAEDATVAQSIYNQLKTKQQI